MSKDPHEINNLANAPAFATKLAELRGRLNQWMEDTHDLGRQPEPKTMYDSDMAVYTERLSGPKFAPAHLKEVQDNISQMKKWAAEGK